MTIIEISTIIIAILSFILSCYVIFRDRNNREYDILYKCYERVNSALDNSQVFTIGEYIEMEENPNSEMAEKIKAESEHISSIVNRELDYACYLLLNKQISLNSFFDLFGRYLAGRLLQLECPKLQYRIINRIYLYKAIELCKREKLLPLNENKGFQQLANYINDFTKNKKPITNQSS